MLTCMPSLEFAGVVKVKVKKDVVAYRNLQYQ